MFKTYLAYSKFALKPPVKLIMVTRQTSQPILCCNPPWHHHCRLHLL